MLVSPIGLGTVKLGRNEGVKYPRAFALPGDEKARELLRLAGDLGINLLDTAPAYGVSEERLGRLLGGGRERWIVSTKVGEEFEGGVSRFDFSAAHVRASVERSLRRLGDWLDVVLVHSDGDEAGAGAPRPGGAAQPLDALHALGELKREGKVRAVGFSAKTAEGARAAMAGSDVLMLTLNPREAEMLPVVREAAAAGVGVLVKKALVSGHLDGLGGDPVEACLRFALGEGGVSSVVVGTIDPAHLRHDVEAAERVLGR
jgi:aryl-alcohol dehydrogenase-like predicted oxidoreductase